MATKDKKNSEGYSDPTAYAVIRNLSREDDRISKLIGAVRAICDLAGFDIQGRITLVDKKTGKIWR